MRTLVGTVENHAEFSKSDRLHSLAVGSGATDLKQIIGGYQQA